MNFYIIYVSILHSQLLHFLHWLWNCFSRWKHIIQQHSCTNMAAQFKCNIFKDHADGVRWGSTDSSHIICDWQLIDGTKAYTRKIHSTFPSTYPKMTYFTPKIHGKSDLCQILRDDIWSLTFLWVCADYETDPWSVFNITRLRRVVWFKGRVIF